MLINSPNDFSLFCLSILAKHTGGLPKESFGSLPEVGTEPCCSLFSLLHPHFLPNYLSQHKLLFSVYKMRPARKTGSFVSVCACTLYNLALISVLIQPTSINMFTECWMYCNKTLMKILDCKLCLLMSLNGFNVHTVLPYILLCSGFLLIYSINTAQYCGLKFV